MQNNFVEYVDELVVQYTTSTEPGSSGSPVLTDQSAVAAIHHAGGVLSEPATKRRYRATKASAYRQSWIICDEKAPDIYQRLTT